MPTPMRLSDSRPGGSEGQFFGQVAVNFSYNGAVRRNGARFAPIAVGERRHQPIALRLSAVLRNAVVMCGELITPDNCWSKTTWPEFQPSLPPGLVVAQYRVCEMNQL